MEGKVGIKKLLPSEDLNRILWPVVALALILLFNLILTSGFFHFEIKDGRLFGSLVDILNRAAPVMLITIGMTLVYATGGVDLSVGAVMAIAGAISAYIIYPSYAAGTANELSLLKIMAIPLVVSLIAGLWNGILVAYMGIQPIVATLILMVAGRGIAQLITEGKIIVFEHDAFHYLGAGAVLGLPVPVVITLVLAVLTSILTRKTSLGVFIEAIGANPTASRFMGIRAQGIKLMVYVFSGFCAGLAGLIICSDIKGADANNAGLFSELDALAAVIIGGTIWGGRFTLLGSMIGALVIQTLTTTILMRGIAPELTLIFKAVVIISVALIQSPALRKSASRVFARMRGQTP